MKSDGSSRLALVAALLPLMVAGCATPGASGGAATTATAPANAAPAAVSAPQPTESAAHTGRPVVTLPPPTELELQVGIQIAHIGLTASGGLIDARFKVLDGAKATALLGNPANVPELIAGDNPPLMAPHHALKGGRFASDQIIFILYPNTRGAIQPGAQVTVAMGATRLGPVTAQ